jgi:hypothetical protein
MLADETLAVKENFNNGKFRGWCPEYKIEIT